MSVVMLLGLAFVAARAWAQPAAPEPNGSLPVFCADAGPMLAQLEALEMKPVSARQDGDDDVWTTWQGSHGRWAITLTLVGQDAVCKIGSGGDWARFRPAKGA